MNYRVMIQDDFEQVCNIFIYYYKNYENEEWSYEAFLDRIKTVYNKSNSILLVAEDNQSIVGFSTGYIVEQGDVRVFYLDELLVAKEWQNKGIGRELMIETEINAAKIGAKVVQLTCVNDEKHNSFYNKLNYEDTKSFVIKHKWLI